MKKHLVLAEKPSVARDYARVLKCYQREQGYLEGPEYIVTWALGHLIELAPPDYYNSSYRRWNLQDLPILPKELDQIVMKQTQNQFSVVQQLMKRADVDSLIIATDAGREGELVARWIMKVASFDKPYKRLWISSQTDEAIIEGFKNLKEGEVYDPLYEAAAARAAADWYVGLNVSRALTTFYKARLSAGRVQSPTLALITRKEDEREAFVGGIYYSIRADFEEFSASYHNEEGLVKIAQEQEAQDIATSLEGKSGVITFLEKSEEADVPPLLFDLTELQRVANDQYGYSAKETLDTLQRLYEVHKVVTYPRTDSRYLTADILSTFKERLTSLESTPIGQIASMYAQYGYRSNTDRLVQPEKVSDHHALLPTEKQADLKRLNEQEKQIYLLVASRFIEALSDDYRYEKVSLTIKVDSKSFHHSYTSTISDGWKAVTPLMKQEGGSPKVHNLALTLNQTLLIQKVRVRRNTTAVPQRYSEATLLSAMEHAGRLVDEADMKKYLSGGLGTPATRAEIIEKLVQNRYIERVDRELVPTGLGRELIRLAPDQLCEAELTAVWEERLSLIAQGKESSTSFLDDIKENTKALIKEIKESRKKFEPTFEGGKECPYCSSPMMKFIGEHDAIHYQCQRLYCAYEERLVKKALPLSTQQPHVVSTTKGKTATTATGRKVVVVKKKAQQPLFETKVEIVQTSRYKKRDTPLSRTDQKENNENEGTTFAALLAASEKRKKERDKGRKRS